MVSIKKRLVALLMTLVMALGLSVSAFAAEPVDVITSNPASTVSEDVSTLSTGKQLASNATTIYGGSGVLYVTLPSGNFWADLVVSIGYAEQNGSVICSVVTPDGTDINLGSVAGSGNTTNAYELFYAPSGTYAFYFFSAMTTPFEVVAYIYD